jgi:TfoX/Sxy family transcriptional regulator of competence genes
MSTSKETVESILGKLGDSKTFSARSMFGEYALYTEEKVVGLICDDQLYVKILSASQRLEILCEQDTPYPGAKPYYVVEEGQLSSFADLPDILVAVAKALPEKKTRPKKSKKE